MNTERPIRIFLLSILSVTAVAGLCHARVLYDQDGIVLEGEAKIVVYNAATCRVLEEKLPEEAYERMKANDGEPLDIWQMSYSVRNGTGRTLAHLRAQFFIESEWPPCSTWKDESGAHAIQYKWAGAVPSIDMTYGMRVDQAVHDKVYLLVFRGQEPFFKEWDVRFRFDAETKANQDEGVPVDRSPPVQQKASPPKDGLELSNRPGCYWIPMESHDIDPEKSSWAWSGECVDGRAQGAGRLTLSFVVEGVKTSWEETGSLHEGKKHGHWVERSGRTGGEGTYVNGKKNGRWVWAHPKEDGTLGNEYEGSWVDGKMHGHWVWRFPHGESEGPMVNNKKHGRWVFRGADGTVWYETYENGERVQ